MKNSISIMKYIFCLIGLGIIIQAFIIYQEKKPFIEKAVLVKGLVLPSSDYRTKVSFVTKEGKSFKLFFDTSNNLIGYNDGESVEVLYDPENPYKAKINSFMTLYLGVSILGIIGSIFFLTGFSFFRSDYNKQKMIKFLKQFGRPVTTRFSSLQLNMHVTVNGTHPYLIYSKWFDSETKKTYLFKSENIWLEPREFNVTNEIMVLIDPKDPNRYYMDISFIKE
ncbi:hypothetical protein HNP37_002514 [Flavobacterium nitrogenifigens]|uniref:DUF3592 domain-containing protein n=2 Tax=Flavobacterium TaxID=237 RepID=A0A7W7N8H0_9FLAO|nr:MULTISPECIES: DUF3592 domain-containing protein [Flavobacterium]MBB4802441.1 hypothetical protein [Flavobacterium nitrogenifigens]MBB6387399.1 hypothetical protein [Flavobacterium notoginsengisoli]